MRIIIDIDYCKLNFLQCHDDLADEEMRAGTNTNKKMLSYGIIQAHILHNKSCGLSI